MTPVTAVGMRDVAEAEEIQRLDLQAPVHTTTAGCAVVRELTFGVTKAAQEYATVTLANRTGARAAKVWHPDAIAWKERAVGDAVYVVARVKDGFRGGAEELEIESVISLSATHPIRLEMNPISPVGLPELRRRFALLRASLGPASRELLDAVLDHVGWEEFLQAPAAKLMHHATIHGLLDHSLEVATVARQLAATCGMAGRRGSGCRSARRTATRCGQSEGVRLAGRAYRRLAQGAPAVPHLSRF